ncbi:hypothetical protein BDV96DRAFT_4262 [Lophiotrema nucula]|uniref:Uncharacterized protein n=1 Tax=Lophiotrema nucula TaxID=690887 RepID=A0A6A5ZT51_9PLEO|nr:hypothetical protein BDV96DRAFT_4262 [Lophiotrema nucula]
MSDPAYFGVWTNWSRGKYYGSTITLSPRGAGFLVAFLAIFVSVAGGSLWRIIAFAVHQTRVVKAPRDGMHYQHEVILRNAGTPGSAAWQLLTLVIPWRRRTHRPVLRSLPLVLLAALNLALFFAAGILVGEVTRTTGTDVLIRSPNCGNWTVNSTNILFGLETKTLNDTITAASYARSCYGDQSNTLECSQYATQALPYSIHQNESCPFADDMCLINWPAFAMDTGNLSSHDHLGINAEAGDRVDYRRKTTCAPIKDKGFITSFNFSDVADGSLGAFSGQDGDIIDFYNFGPVVFSEKPKNNFTLAYNRRQATVGYGYDLTAVNHDSNKLNNLWQPDKAVARDDGDVSLMFLAANDIQYYGEVLDPIFEAVDEIAWIIDNGKNVSLYTSRYFVNPFGCVDQHQFCNPTTKQCTKLNTYFDAVNDARGQLGLNAMQHMVVSIMSLNLVLTTIAENIDGRGSAALRAQEQLSGLNSLPLPPNQWQIETEYWFTTGLAKLQKYFVEYAAGPSNIVDGLYLSRPSDTASRQVCDNLKIKAPPGSGATSFSTMGVAIILGVGGLLILAHFILSLVVGTFIPNRTYKLQRWGLDDKLQMQRLAFEGAGQSEWEQGFGGVPVTREEQLFAMELEGGNDQPRLQKIGTGLSVLSAGNSEAKESTARIVEREESMEAQRRSHEFH